MVSDSLRFDFWHRYLVCLLMDVYVCIGGCMDGLDGCKSDA